MLKIACCKPLQTVTICIWIRHPICSAGPGLRRGNRRINAGLDNVREVMPCRTSYLAFISHPAIYSIHNPYILYCHPSWPAVSATTPGRCLAGRCRHDRLKIPHSVRPDMAMHGISPNSHQIYSQQEELRAVMHTSSDQIAPEWDMSSNFQRPAGCSWRHGRGRGGPRHRCDRADCIA